MLVGKKDIFGPNGRENLLTNYPKDNINEHTGFSQALNCTMLAYSTTKGIVKSRCLLLFIFLRPDFIGRLNWRKKQIKLDFVGSSRVAQRKAL